MDNTSIIELSSPKMQFSSAHFTIFSSKDRENLHGHNFKVSCKIIALIGPNGMAFDYNLYKSKLIAICNSLDELLLLPTKSPHLKIIEKDNYYHCRFAEEEISFLKRDVKTLPISNITVEELSRWILLTLLKNIEEFSEQEMVEEIAIKVASSPSQSANSIWRAHY